MSDGAVQLSVRSVPRKSERIAARDVDGKAVVVVLDAHKLHTLNAVGTRVFNLCDGTRDVAEIAAAIAREFEVDASRAERDALAFLTQLLAQGAIAIDPPGGSR